MTWVVGGTHLACARCIADVQVTLEFHDGKKLYYDAVQKIHPIGENVVMAYAGSIKSAFYIIEKIKSEFYEKLDKRLFVEPYEVAKKIAKSIRYFHSKCEKSKTNTVEFLLFIAPKGLYTEFGAYKLVSPDFSLFKTIKPFGLLQLGSGSAVNEYQHLVRQHEFPGYSIPSKNGELPTLVIPTGKGAIQYLFSQALDYQNAGISKAMHVCRLSHAETLIEGLPENPLDSFPDTAKTWVELKKYLKAKGVAIAECHAIAA